MRPRRIFFFSHDAFGLGHLRRTLRIANRLAGPDRSILVACASPEVTRFTVVPGIACLRLPGVVRKQSSREYVPAEPGRSLDALVALRSGLLLDAVRSFDPDLVIVDHEPAGIRNELLPPLAYLREARGDCRIVCGFRDILEEREAVALRWKERDTAEILERYYDSIWVYGEQSFLDFAAIYGLPPVLSARVVYTGYIWSEEPSTEGLPTEPAFQFGGRKPVVTFTIGGGGDGWDFLETFLEVIRDQPLPMPYQAVALTGPFACAALVAKARDLAEQRDDFQVITFTTHSQQLFRTSQQVISMGGYNTLCELAALRRYPLILPRVSPRREQLIRAEAFQRRGYCEYLHPNELTAKVLGDRITSLLEAPPLPAPVFVARGLDCIQGLVERWA